MYQLMQSSKWYVCVCVLNKNNSSLSNDKENINS